MPAFIRLSFMLIALLCINASPLHAQDTAQTEAQRLQTLFQSIIDRQKEKIESQENDERQLHLEGSVAVEPIDNYYAITLPPMSIHYPDGGRVQLGMISMNASAHDKPDQLKITLALPSPILGFDENGQEVMRVTIDGQRTAGIWHEKLESFVKLDALYKDVRIDLGTEDVAIRLPEVITRYDLEEDESGRWSGPTYMEAKDAKLETQTQDVSGSIKSIKMSMNLDKLSSDAFHPDQINGRPGKSMRLDMADGMEMRFSIGGVKLSNPDESISLESAAAFLRFNDALSGSADVHFGFNFKNADASNMPEDIGKLAPRNANIGLTHHNIPLKDISTALGGNAAAGQVSGLSILLKLPALLSQAGSYIEIKDNFLGNDNYRLDLNAILRADIMAVHSATAEGTLAFNGLDKVLSMTQVSGTDLHGSPYAMFMRELARFLERLKPIGKVETDPEKGFTHIFDFAIDEQGRFLINGQDAMPLLSEESSRPEPEEPVEP